jgi:hypothetical protein
VVGYGCYCIFGDSLAHNYQKAILGTRTTSYVVTTVKQQFEDDDIFPQCFNVLAYFVFIEMSNSSSREDLTPLPLSMELPKGIFQFNASLSSKPSTHMGKIQSLAYA